MIKKHSYTTKITWTGNLGEGTSSYRKYRRNHVLEVKGKERVKLSADPAFRGDVDCINPEELLLSSLSSCHMLWYLHLCAENGIRVLSYIDNATAIMEESKDGSGAFVSVTLHPEIQIDSEEKMDLAEALHHSAHEKCFIANSVNFPVSTLPKISSE